MCVYIYIYIYIYFYIYIYICLFLYKGICCGYLFELHQLADAIQMGTHNICFYEEDQEKKCVKTSHKHHEINPLLIFFIGVCCLSIGGHIFYFYNKFSE